MCEHKGRIAERKVQRDASRRVDIWYRKKDRTLVKKKRLVSILKARMESYFWERRKELTDARIYKGK